jgi:hypothetical protein
MGIGYSAYFAFESCGQVKRALKQQTDASQKKKEARARIEL